MTSARDVASVSAHAYPFDTADPGEHRRLEAHRDMWDTFTMRKLADTGVTAGWRCLEIGAGTGSVAAWLLDRVGPDGQVVATDIETRWLEPMATANLVVRHHNVSADPLEQDGFDLIHARLVLEHLPRPEAVAAKLVAALRPGGWLVVEDYDVRTMAFTEPRHDAWSACATAVPDVMRRAGSDPLYGARLLDLFDATELVDVAVEGYLRLLPIPDLAPVFRPALEGLREPLVRSGAVTGSQLDAAIAAFDDRARPTLGYTPILVAASGRRP